MALIDKLFGRQKSLSQLSPVELRKEEILIGKSRDKLINKIEQVANQKQKIFNQGAQQKSPELRKALAIEFELKTREQLMSVRELNVRSKELLTVSRVRMVREHQAKSNGGLGRLNVTEKDFAVLGALIEDDAVTQELYTERLDQLLEMGESSDRDALANATMGEAGSELLALWDQLDRGSIKEDEALGKAEDAVRRKVTDKTMS